ncbi:MAG: hypothetical protein ACPKMZ_11100 [Pleomorphochaeta sp.]
MKKIFIFFILIFISTSAFALNNNRTLGIGVGYDDYFFSHNSSCYTIKGPYLSLYSEQSICNSNDISTYLETHFSTPSIYISSINDPNNIIYNRIEGFNNQFLNEAFLGLKLSYSISKKSYYFISVGPSITSLYFNLDNTEYYDFNLGALISFGIKTNLTEKVSINLESNYREGLYNIFIDSSNQDKLYDENSTSSGLDFNVQLMFKL